MLVLYKIIVIQLHVVVLVQVRQVFEILHISNTVSPSLMELCSSKCVFVQLAIDMFFGCSFAVGCLLEQAILQVDTWGL